MFYHASQIPALTELTPQVSNHGISLVYLSSKRENVLVYLSNGVEKHCKETGFLHAGPYKKWGSYGFENGILRLEEYYPNATVDTYQGVSGYIYSCEEVDSGEELEEIPFVLTTREKVKVNSCEFVPDAYEAIMEAVRDRKIILKKFEENDSQMINWIQASIRNEYAANEAHPEYQAFLKAKFHDLLL